MDRSHREQTINAIQQNIARNGHHVYVVASEDTPRFAYTIGVSESIGIELILAGAIFYMKDEILQIINNIAAELKTNHNQRVFEVAGLGSFTVRKVHDSWTGELLLGAFDYYHKRDILALQIVPDDAHRTVDVPDMSVQWNASTEPVWRWLKEPWSFPVPKGSTTATNLAALRGQRITEVMRWEADEWEMFAGAGPDVTKDDMRVVPLGTLMAADESLIPVMDLSKGEGLWRDPDLGSEWHPWNKGQHGTVQ